jgi:uncharacterized protein (TIGR02452 family)
VNLRSELDASVKRTVEYPPWTDVPNGSGRRFITNVTVRNETVLSAGRRLAAVGSVAALNFASATHPGGAFRAGVSAQEETIARASGLFACLEGQPMYDFHRTQADAMHSDYVIYAPDVPVFRSDEGQLLDVPWRLSILTSPAANANLLVRDAPERIPEIPWVMRERARKVLGVAIHHGHIRLILGAWGCGVFGIESVVTATIFRDLLAGAFCGAFEEIVFAITDRSDEQRVIGPFRRAFAMAGPVQGCGAPPQAHSERGLTSSDD